MRFSLLETACVVAIAVAALQLQARDPDARMFVPPTIAALKDALPVHVAQRDPALGLPEGTQR